MLTIREALSLVKGEDPATFPPIFEALKSFGFSADDKAGDTFCALPSLPDYQARLRACGLTDKQRLALQVAISKVTVAAGSSGAGVSNPAAPDSEHPRDQEGRAVGGAASIPQAFFDLAAVCAAGAPAAECAVSRLLYSGAGIGTAVRIALVAADANSYPVGDIVLTARHCVEQGGACLPDLRAFGGELHFLAARPDLDVALFRGPVGRGLLLQQFGLQPGTWVWLISFPLPIDLELCASPAEAVAAEGPGAAAAAAVAVVAAAASAPLLDEVPTVSEGVVSKISRIGLTAVASMNTAGMPNSSGGAVLSSPNTLAGVYTALVWHLEELVGSSSSSSGGIGSGGGRGGGSIAQPPADVELDPAAMWRPPPNDAADAVSAAAGDVEKAAELSRLNIQHISSASLFTTAAALWQLLEQCHAVARDSVQAAHARATAMAIRAPRVKRARLSES